MPTYLKAIRFVFFFKQYAAPEILKGILYDPSIADMWAYGVLIFTMLNKSVPFDDKHVPVSKNILLH